MAVFAQLQRLQPGALLTALLLALLLWLPPGTAQASVAQRWSSADSHGDRWQLSLFEQSDPAYAGGWRLRLNGLSPGIQPDHAQALQLRDGLGGEWQLGNLSAELVPPGGSAPPPGSAQFDLAPLQPRPSDALPLGLELAMADGSVRQLTLGVGSVQALSQLPSGDSP
ncbi:MAG: DUF3122 domain-containing protein [Prochlorococcaceae cyanobacterium]